MTFATRFGLCGFVFCCLLFVVNIQSAKCRILEQHNALQIRQVSIPPQQQNVEIVKKSEARVCVGSFDCEKESIDLRKHKNVLEPEKDEVHLLRQFQKSWIMKELILNPQLLPRGRTPSSRPNHDHNAIVFAEENVKGKDKLVTNSLPKGPTPPSGSNPPHNKP